MARIKQIDVFFSLCIATIWMLTTACQPNTAASATEEIGVEPEKPALQTGAEQMDAYLPMLTGKRVGMVVNHTSHVGDRHLVDTLHARGVAITRIFAPEHGFRGEADAGASIADGKDRTTGAPITSLYGTTKKPTPEHLTDLDLVVFDIQDVGVRFYTYISTMTYVMEACAEQGIPFIVLDRPNPNGHYTDGPVLDPAYSSFVGMHPVPVAHGMTVGEYAQMVNGEGWLKGGVQADLSVIKCTNYTHDTPYELPIKPSPNLPNMQSIYLYPSLCFFEPTTISVGRGTDKQFQVLGMPKASFGDYTFMPIPKPGARKPKHEGRECTGYDLTSLPPDSVRQWAGLNLTYLVDIYQSMEDKSSFFTSDSFFDKLAGGPGLRQKLTSGASAEEIKASWQSDLEDYRAMRSKYLLYP